MVAFIISVPTRSTVLTCAGHGGFSERAGHCRWSWALRDVALRGPPPEAPAYANSISRGGRDNIGRGLIREGLPRGQRPKPPISAYDSRRKCIVCSALSVRRLCEEVHGHLRADDTKAARLSTTAVSARAGRADDFLSSDCVKCGACVLGLPPTATLQEKSVIELGTPTAFGRDHLRLLRRGLFLQVGTQRRRAGAHGSLQARQGEPGPFPCVKARFAGGYANHAERILNPMIRETIDEPWRGGQLGGGG